jgi:hypothetical protein
MGSITKDRRSKGSLSLSEEEGVEPSLLNHKLILKMPKINFFKSKILSKNSSEDFTTIFKRSPAGSLSKLNTQNQDLNLTQIKLKKADCNPNSHSFSL